MVDDRKVVQIIIIITIVIIIAAFIQYNQRDVRIYMDVEFNEVSLNTSVRIDANENTLFFIENTSMNYSHMGIIMHKGNYNFRVYLNGSEITGNGEKTINDVGFLEFEIYKDRFYCNYTIQNY